MDVPNAIVHASYTQCSHGTCCRSECYILSELDFEGWWPLLYVAVNTTWVADLKELKHAWVLFRG